MSSSLIAATAVRSSAVVASARTLTGWIWLHGGWSEQAQQMLSDRLYVGMIEHQGGRQRTVEIQGGAELIAQLHRHQRVHPDVHETVVARRWVGRIEAKNLHDATAHKSRRRSIRSAGLAASSSARRLVTTA